MAQNITYDKPTLRFELFFDWHYQQILDAFKSYNAQKMNFFIKDLFSQCENVL